MATEALIVSERPDRQIVITSEQTDLIKATIAKDATDAELALFFYDCKRRGVHPLDKLIHFTKRKGKYTPVTSIDYFRSRAAETTNHMGTDDAVFRGTPRGEDFEASVTVYRMVQGEKCPFTATARWMEYLPESGSDFMWLKMPHGQLAKCAEALALRKAFPQELQDLHTFEEMDQASRDPTPAAPPREVKRASETGGSTKASGPTVNGQGGFITEPRKVKDVKTANDKKGNTFYVLLLDGDPTEYTTRDATQAVELEKWKGTDHLLRVRFKKNEWQGRTYSNIETFVIADAEMPPAGAIDQSEIPFGR